MPIAPESIEYNPDREAPDAGGIGRSSFSGTMPTTCQPLFRRGDHQRFVVVQLYSVKSEA